MRAAMFILFGLFAVVASCSARLGETPEQIQKRYGLPSKTNEVSGVTLIPIDTPGYLFGLPTTNYIFNGYIITVSFKGGKSVREVVRSSDARPLSEGECLGFRDRIGAGLNWEGGGSIDTYWKTKEGVIAERRGSEFVLEGLEFTHHFRAYISEQNKRKAEADKQKAVGF